MAHLPIAIYLFFSSLIAFMERYPTLLVCVRSSQSLHFYRFQVLVAVCKTQKRIEKIINAQCLHPFMFGAFQIQPYICTVFHGIRFKVSKRLVVERQSIFFIPTPTNDDWQAVCATPFRAMNAISRNKDNGMQAMEGLLLLHLHPVVGLNGWRIHLLHSLVTCRYGKAKHRLHLFLCESSSFCFGSRHAATVQLLRSSSHRSVANFQHLLSFILCYVFIYNLLETIQAALNVLVFAELLTLKSF